MHRSSDQCQLEPAKTEKGDNTGLPPIHEMVYDDRPLIGFYEVDE
jgi:hypothetical protein